MGKWEEVTRLQGGHDATKERDIMSIKVIDKIVEMMQLVRKDRSPTIFILTMEKFLVITHHKPWVTRVAKKILINLVDLLVLIFVMDSLRRRSGNIDLAVGKLLRDERIYSEFHSF